jgi:DEAD/DEAH box helicase domain-containing protein
LRIWLKLALEPNLIEPDRAFWLRVHHGLIGAPSEKRLEVIVRNSIEEAARRLTDACWDKVEKRYRPMPLSAVANHLFESPNAIRALRTLTIIRGYGQYFTTWFPQSESTPQGLTANSFRLHSFFRNIDGLYATAAPNQDKRICGPLSVERGLSHQTVDMERRRLLQLLYCEACGELFFGGMRAQTQLAGSMEFELLPSSPDLENAPDAIQTQLVDDCSWDDFALFWPLGNSDRTPVAGEWAGESWPRLS